MVISSISARSGAVSMATPSKYKARPLTGSHDPLNSSLSKDIVRFAS